LSNVEVINLAADNKQCPSLPDYPVPVAYHTTAFYQGAVVSCGGYNGERLDQCYELGPDLREWVELLSLPTSQNDEMKSSVIDGKWVISGGDTDPTSLVVFDGIFTPSPSMPFEKKNHCQLTLNSTHIFFTAGEGDTLATFMLDWPTQEWIVLDDIPSGSMSEPACGFVKTPLGQEVVLASDTRSFIFSLDDMQWREGPLLPEDLDNLTNVQLNNYFLVVGGLNRGNYEEDTIYRFDPNSYTWLREVPMMAIPRKHTGAVAVPDDFLACN